HVAFVAADYEGTVTALARVSPPGSRTSDAAMFRTPDGTRLEIVRNVEAPDAFWCPMHPDVRSGTPGTCPICSMVLVAIPPTPLGEYRMDVRISPGRRGGLAGLRLSLYEPNTRARVVDLSVVHERL